jgi:hypothetical protein
MNEDRTGWDYDKQNISMVSYDGNMFTKNHCIKQSGAVISLKTDV